MTPDQVQLVEGAMQAFTTVLVAVLVGFFASGREMKGANTRRLFSLADDRRQLYTEFLRQADLVWASQWELSGGFEGVQGKMDNSNLNKIKVQAIKLDSLCNAMKITAPYSVSNACSSVNGHLQTMVIGLEQGREGYRETDWRDFEAAKAKMIDEMKADLKLMETSRDRSQYQKKASKYLLEKRGH